MIAVTGATGHLGRLIVKRTLEGFFLPESVAEMLADADEGLERGVLYTDSGDLSRLIGRLSTTLSQAVSAALRD